MYRTIIILAVALMLCGTTLADKTKTVSNQEGKTTMSVASDVKETVKAEKKVEKAKRKRSARRLPNHFKAVVTDEQKEKIYKIQTEYAPTITEYREKLAKALKERNEKINAILTTKQVEKIEQLRKASKARRKHKAAKKAAAAEMQ